SAVHVLRRRPLAAATAADALRVGRPPPTAALAVYVALPAHGARGAVTLDAEVIVVGGGPAGAATAWGLARAGIDVLVLDRARFPRDKPCAEYLSPQASRILDAMGVLEAAESAGGAQLSGMLVRAP